MEPAFRIRLLISFKIPRLNKRAYVYDQVCYQWSLTITERMESAVKKIQPRKYLVEQFSLFSLCVVCLLFCALYIEPTPIFNLFTMKIGIKMYPKFTWEKLNAIFKNVEKYLEENKKTINLFWNQFFNTSKFLKAHEIVGKGSLLFMFIHVQSIVFNESFKNE